MPSLGGVHSTIPMAVNSQSLHQSLQHLYPDLNSRVKVLVTLMKTFGGNEPHKKLMLVVRGQDKIFVLKRTIEREFMDLFPNEQPYVVAKLEDENGFALSNNSNIGDFLVSGQGVIAQPEPLKDPQENIHGGGAAEMLQMM